MGCMVTLDIKINEYADVCMCVELKNNLQFLKILKYTSPIHLIGPTTSVLLCDGLSICKYNGGK